MPEPTPHEAELIKSAESLMRVIPDEARYESIHQYCNGCGCDDLKCQCWSDD